MDKKKNIIILVVTSIIFILLLILFIVSINKGKETINELKPNNDANIKSASKATVNNEVEISLILKILLIKIFFGIIYGLIIDKIINKNKKDKETNYELCDEEHCDCNHSILLSAIKHTLHITLFIFIITLIINTIFTLLGDNYLSKILLNNSILSPFITSLIGLIPNCAASVILTELYLNSTISLGALIGGLLTSSGSSLLVLIKNNKNKKENLSIILLLYTLGVLSGIIIELISLIK
jgi:hypothetical protein